MFYKSVVLNIFSSIAPFRLIISRLNGEVLLNKIVAKKYFNTCICCNDAKIAVKIEANTQSQTSYLSLNNCKCQCHNLNFTFVNLNFNQRFTLFDANYNFPIPYANLVLIEKPQLSS